MHDSVSFARGLGSFVLLTLLATNSVSAQPGPGRGTPRAATSPEAKRLDAKMEQVADIFMRETAALITSYENIGQFDRARTLLEAVQKLDPHNAEIKQKLDEIHQKILVAHEFDFEIDPDATWQEVGAVQKGRTIRIKVAGDYKLSMGVTAAADGVPNGAPGEGLVAGLPLGAVVGVILAPDMAAALVSGKRNDKQPRPFLVGSTYEKPADQDGILSLKTNVPPGTKCSGRLKARISGPVVGAATR
jgi:hypothetical protein